MKRTKAQASLEFLIVVGIGISILIPIVYLTINYKSEISDIRSVLFTKSALKELETNSLIVFNQGVNSKKTIYIFLPSNMASFAIENNRFIVVRIKMSYGEEDLFIEMPFNVSYSSLPSEYGKYKVVITSTEEGVHYEFSKIS